ncbi:hypothetical protein [Mucilaginibacter kameinonensis]|uniref:hypothetical protein n=1 Tax=Mucilaginibacter kameinonensis TaxID=452286 RepID=UPI000EF7CE2D|nr:hypothetical protein [Mucilaginibacter kameinonensis]
MKTTDSSYITDFILNSVLPFYTPTEHEIVYVQAPGENKAVRGFNADTQIIITKEEFDVIAGMVSEVMNQVKEIHAVQVGKLLTEVEKKQKPKKLTPKQQRELEEEERKLEVQALRNNADRKILNGL